MPTEDGLHPRRRCLTENSDLLNQAPRTESVNQELGLLAALTVHVFGTVGPVPLVHHVPVDLVEMGQVVEPLGEAGQAVPIGEGEACAGRLHGLAGRDQVYQRLLAFAVRDHLARLEL